VYNIQKAVSRLDYAPKLKEIEITDIKKGLGVFTPKPAGVVSLAALKQTLKKAGYTLASADITITGKLSREVDKWIIASETSGQKFQLEGKAVDELLAKIAPDSIVEITGTWKTIGEGAAAQEIIDPEKVTKAETKTARNEGKINFNRNEAVNFIKVNYFAPSAPYSPKIQNGEKPESLAPIRTTSPGLTVYQGGAITPRFYFIKQHLGDLDVTRELLDISLSYTPTQRLQLEAEVPISRTSFDNEKKSGSAGGLGNITLWGKYRFFRTVKTYGDRQAAARFGLELPTGKKTAPTAQAVNAPAFIRQQLTPISGGLSPHFDLSFSQAGGRFIFGGNVEAIARTEREGFRMGHELRINTDFEYVLLPRDYQKPGKELFLIFETSFVTRRHGRLNGETVSGSTSTEYYLSPGLQYAADPRFVIEGSVQFPVFRNIGPQVLRTDLNLLLGVKYLF
jgi:hypothetical protein